MNTQPAAPAQTGAVKPHAGKTRGNAPAPEPPSLAPRHSGATGEAGVAGGRRKAGGRGGGDARRDGGGKARPAEPGRRAAGVTCHTALLRAPLGVF